jgi:hypothetical protein
MSNTDGLAEYRKKLHTLLHNNTNNPNSNINTKVKNVKFQNLNTNVLNNESGKLNKKITELENTIEMKNKRIVLLSKANLEKVEVIKTLNEKIDHLQNLNNQKSSRIEQLEKIIVEMQNSYQEQVQQNQIEPTYDIDNLDFDDTHDLNTTGNFLNKTTTTSRNSILGNNLDNDIDLSTQHLLELDLNQLTFSNTGIGIYNTSKQDTGDNIESYLFEV